MSFVLETHELARKPGSEREFVLNESAPDDFAVGLVYVPSGSAIEVNGRMEAVLEGVYISGDITAQLRGECSRCLETFEYETVENFAELFSHEPSDEPEEFALVGDLADLEQVIRDALLLDVSIKPLCMPDCKGLCPTCGTNLNEQPDHEHDEPIDPRWSALGSLGADDE